MNTTRILVVDDHPLLRRGVLQLLEQEAGLLPVGEASNGPAALECARALEPDLILLDLNMHGMSGVETLQALRANGSHARVIVLTVSDSDDDVVAALRAGADGYLLKDMEPEELVRQLRRAADGELVVSEELTPVLARALSRPPDRRQEATEELTSREKEILRLIARGLSNKMIANQLDITEGTTKVHVKNLLKKLGLRSRVEAAVWAVNRERR